MTSGLFTLPVVEQLSSSISLRIHDELRLLVITHPEFQAAFSLQGGQLIAWQPHGKAPIIWLSDKTSFAQGKAIRGGVPICWPWFGPAGKPSHGFARTAEWTLTHTEESAQEVTLSMVLKQSAQTLALWPHDFTLTLTATLSAQACKLTLTILGDVESTAALHSYFHVADSEKIAVSGLGETFIDKVENNRVSTQQGVQTYHNEVDRIFTHPDSASIIDDPLLGRAIHLHHAGNSDVVTWNPGTTLSQSMTDMSDDGYKTMVCVETARIQQPFITTSTSPATLSVTITPHYR
ncbi:D-hexose-6-phosphate mutarotase [Rosenbergiella australiborealis]|uniref:D-hexose-6-phosphate mutarotase n=1 Tax=Rosenbergiella australiborealis TaxID=1544696 RepID=UPI001F4E9262|nr:D-hexose-6-phosphate mutarotase [Rosenbergiella australiborealis]